MKLLYVYHIINFNMLDLLKYMLNLLIVFKSLYKFIFLITLSLLILIILKCLYKIIMLITL